MNSVSPRRVMVIGGTGLVGIPIVKGLEAAAWDVRVMSRRAHTARESVGAGVELIEGDANRRDDLARAMAGCGAAVVCVTDLQDPELEVRVTEHVVALAPEAGIHRIGLISGASVAVERRWFRMIDAKYRAEEVLKAGATPWVILRLTWLMESMHRFIRGNNAMILGKQPAIIHPVAGADVGRMVAAALDLEQAAQTLTIHGPDPFTMEGFLRDYFSLLGTPSKITHVPLWVLTVLASLTFNRPLRAAVDLMRYFDRLPEFGDPAAANLLLGAPRIRLGDWASSGRVHAPALLSQSH